VFDGAKVKDLRVTRMARDQVSFSGTFEGTLAERNALGLITVKAGGIAGGMTDTLPQLPALARQVAMALPEAGEERLELSLTLPKGWAVRALPEAVGHTNALGSVLVESKIGGEAAALRLTILRRITLTERSGFSTEADLAPQVRQLANAWNTFATREILLNPAASK